MIRGVAKPRRAIVPVELDAAMHAILTDLGRLHTADAHEADMLNLYAVKAYRALVRPRDRISAADLERAAKARYRVMADAFGLVDWADLAPPNLCLQIDAMRAALESLGLSVEGDAP